MQKIDFYCRKCKKSLKLTYVLSWDKDIPVLSGMIIRCHTNKCTRVMTLKNYTEDKIRAQANDVGKCYI